MISLYYSYETQDLVGGTCVKEPGNEHIMTEFDQFVMHGNMQKQLKVRLLKNLTLWHFMHIKTSLFYAMCDDYLYIYAASH